METNNKLKDDIIKQIDKIDLQLEESEKYRENEENKETQEQNQQIKETIRQTHKPPKQKKSNTPRNILGLLTIGIIAVFMFWTNKATTPDNSTLIMIITLSVLANIVILALMLGTGIGIEITKRFLNKFKYKSGNYVNSLHIMKTGVIKERFTKKDDETGTIRIRDQPYITNPKLLFTYKGIQTYVHREGNPDPLNIWDEKLAGKLSNAEMDIAMNSKGAFDVKAWLDRNKNMLLIGVLAIIVIGASASYFGYQTYQMLRDGTFQQLTTIACNNLPETIETIAKTSLGA